MDIVGLISGGKDSFYTVQKMIEEGNNIVALLHMAPSTEEIDSYMYQTVGSELIEAYRECTDIPIFIYKTACTAINKELHYKPTLNDEVEDLYCALRKIQNTIQFEGICSGAILSTYQKIRVENVCERLGVKSLAPLWNKNQEELFTDISSTVEGLIVKIASPVFKKECIGMTLNQLGKYMKGKGLKDFNYCGEGGEYESLITDAPFFNKKITILDYEIMVHPEDKGKENGVYYIRIKKYETVNKK